MKMKYALMPFLFALFIARNDRPLVSANPTTAPIECPTIDTLSSGASRPAMSAACWP